MKNARMFKLFSPLVALVSVVALLGIWAGESQAQQEEENTASESSAAEAGSEAAEANSGAGDDDDSAGGADEALTAGADGGGGNSTSSEKSAPEWSDSGAPQGAIKVAGAFVEAIAAGEFDSAFQMGGNTFRVHDGDPAESATPMDLEKFTAAMEETGFSTPATVDWQNGTQTLAGPEGFTLMGKRKFESGKETRFYLELVGDAHVAEGERNRAWSDGTQWTVSEYRPANFHKEWKDSSLTETAAAFIEAISTSDFPGAYALGGETLRTSRTLEQFTADMQGSVLNQPGTVTWTKGTKALPGSNGFKLMGALEHGDGSGSTPVYMHLQGDPHVSLEDRDRDWWQGTAWSVLDYRSGQSFVTRLKGGGANGLDWLLAISSLLLLLAFVGMVWTYVSGLRGSPRELYLMFFTKLTEYSAYGAASAIFVLYLSNDVLAGGQPLGDTNAYLFYTVWGLALTVVTIMVGSVCDTIGVKKCLLIGAVMLLTSRFFMPLSQNVVVVALVGFLPLAIGFAITGPVLKVGIKMFTTLKTATLGFGLFYTMMNVGFYFGATIADWFRETYGDTGTVPVLGMELTTYQAIIGVGFLINIPDFIAILIMRDGAEMTEKGLVLKEKSDGDETAVIAALRSNVATRRRKIMGELFKSSAAVLAVAGLSYVMIQTEVHKWAINVVPVGKYIWALVVVLVLFSVGGVLYALFSQAGTLKAGGGFDRAMKAVRDATQGTIAQLKENFQQKPFWIYMGMLGILVFVRLTFYIFHVMFPTYATRVLGPDFPVASIFGALNPAMIVFLVPLISILSINIRSYTMLLIGTAVSAGSVFLCFMPESMALGLGNTWLGTWIFDYWLEAPVGSQDPFVVSLVVFIIVFTIGEAIWSPRLMQFSAEIAPRGKEGAYIALAMLPYFVGKMGAAVLSEQLTTRFFNDSMVAFPKHQLAWLAIGSMALISPIGLVMFRKVFSQSERMAELEATAAAAAAESD